MSAKLFTMPVGIALGLGMAVSAGAQTAQEVERVKQEALNRDAEFISRHSGLPYEDVQRQLRLQAANGSLISGLREEFKDRFAGIYAEHYPIDRIVVRLTGDAPVVSRKLQFGNDPLVVDFIVAQAYSLVELVNAIVEKSTALKKHFPQLQGLSADERTGEVVLDILPPGKDPEAIEKMRSIAQEILQVPARINSASSEPLKLQASIIAGGALPLIQCTAGFAVRNIINNTKGIVTADHCGPGNTPYVGYGNNSGTVFMDEQSGKKTASEDMRWYKPFSWGFYSHYVDPSIYGESTDTLIPVTGKKIQAETAIGQRVCHRGITTGYSCGNVESLNHQPTGYQCGPDANPVTCLPIWIKVVPPSVISTPGLACAGGDSGGPVFAGTLAVGIHIAGASYGNETGECVYMVYMSTDRIIGLGIDLLYWP